MACFCRLQYRLVLVFLVVFLLPFLAFLLHVVGILVKWVPLEFLFLVQVSDFQQHLFDYQFSLFLLLPFLCFTPPKLFLNCLQRYLLKFFVDRQYIFPIFPFHFSVCPRSRLFASQVFFLNLFMKEARSDFLSPPLGPFAMILPRLFTWSLKVYSIEQYFTKPNQPVLYYLHDGPKRGFVHEELLVVPPNTQLPPTQL